MGNYLKMSDKRFVLALLELGWTYRRIERETGVRRETIARYDPRRESKAANLSAGAEVSADDGAPKAANLSVGWKAAHGPPGLAAPTAGRRATAWSWWTWPFTDRSTCCPMMNPQP
jgi:hypothetical protein